MNGDRDGDELGGDSDQIPALRIGIEAPIYEVYMSTIHIVAKKTVNDVVRQAVGELTQLLTEAERNELICQAVAAIEPPSRTKEVEENVPELKLSVTQYPNAVVHADAKEFVVNISNEAIKEILQAVEKATEWISQAVSNELVSKAIHSEKCIPIRSVTEGIAQAVSSEFVARTVANALLSSDISTTFKKQGDFADDTELTTVQEIPQLLMRVGTSSVDNVRELAKATAEASVHEALHNVSHAINDASESFVQAACVELLAQTVVEASPEISHVAAVDNSFTDSTDSDDQNELPPSPKEVDDVVRVPVLLLPNASSRSLKKRSECHELAELFVIDVVSSVLHQKVPDNSNKTEDDDYDDDYTPINTPTAESLQSESPPPSTCTSEPVRQFEPLIVLSGRATPPDSNPSTRRSPRTPNTNKSEPVEPPSPETSPISARVAMSITRLVEEIPVLSSEPDPPHVTLPPLILPGSQGPQQPSRVKHHQQKTPRKTSRQTSCPSYIEKTTRTNDSPRAATTSSLTLDKHTSRASNSAESTSLSSARAAVLIYAPQPSSPQRHHKANKLRGVALCPPSPPPLATPRKSLLEDHVAGYGTELPKTSISHVKKHSLHALLPPESGTEKKAGRSNNILLVPLSKTPMGTDILKLPSPSRKHKHHGHDHIHKDAGGIPSPIKRSGYCQRCVFEGRSCKINDCLKHQVLK